MRVSFAAAFATVRKINTLRDCFFLGALPTTASADRVPPKLAERSAEARRAKAEAIQLFCVSLDCFASTDARIRAIRWARNDVEAAAEA
jgi:hypothetical protein